MIDLDHESTILYLSKKREYKISKKVIEKKKIKKKMMDEGKLFQLKDMIHESEHERIDKIAESNPELIGPLLDGAKKAKLERDLPDLKKESEIPIQEPDRVVLGKEVLDNMDKVLNKNKKSVSHKEQIANDKYNLQCAKYEQEIQRLKIDNDKQSGKSVDRKIITQMFSKLYSIDINEFLQLKDILVEKMAIELKVTDPELILKSHEVCERELYKTQSHIKRRIDEFLTQLGGLSKDGEKVQAS